MQRVTAAAVVFLALAISAPASAQTISIGVKGGYDQPTLAGSHITAPQARNALAGGIFLALPLSASFALQPELLYVAKGAELTEPTVTTAAGTLRLTYREVPLLARFVVSLPHSRLRPALVAGPYLAFKVGCSFEASSGSTSGDCSSSSAGGFDIERRELGATFGAGIEWPMGRFSGLAEARYDLGLTSIDNSYCDASPTTNPLTWSCPPTSDSRNHGILVLIGASFSLGIPGRAASVRGR